MLVIPSFLLLNEMSDVIRRISVRETVQRVSTRTFILPIGQFIVLWFIVQKSVQQIEVSFLLASGIFLIFHFLKDRHPLSSKQKRKLNREMREIRLNNELELDIEEQRRWNEKKQGRECVMEKTRPDG